MEYISRVWKGFLTKPLNFLKLPLTVLLSLATLITSSFGVRQPALQVSRGGDIQSEVYDVGFGKCEIMPESLTDAQGN